MHQPRRLYHRAPHQGFTLIEVLVTILLICIGMLGSVGLQVASLQANAQTEHQVVAAGLASELAESLRGNNQVALLRTTAANPYLISHKAGSPAAPTVDCRTGACVGNTANHRKNTAAWQAYDWLSRAMNSLPGIGATNRFHLERIA